MKKVKEARDCILSKIRQKPDIAVVLGTGLGGFGECLENPIVIPYEEIPHFPVSTVQGHAGRFLFGEMEGRNVLLMQGRFHYYEGYSPEQVTFPIRVIFDLGCTHLVLTNAAGGVNRDVSSGDLMLIEDHILLGAPSPLRGANWDDYGPRFPDSADVYSKAFNSEVENMARELEIPLRKGVYFFMPGPQFETAAEIRMIRTLGGDVVGMSTVPEAIVASHMKMRVTGISCVTNMGTGVLETPIDHDGIQDVARKVEAKFAALVRRIIAATPKCSGGSDAL